MKTKCMLLLLMVALFSFPLFSQSSFGTLSGRIVDSATNQAVEFANVVIMQGDNQIAGTISDNKGYYSFSALKPGTYDIGASYVGYKQYKQVGIIVSTAKITKLDIVFAPGDIILPPTDIIIYKIPLVDPDAGSGKTIGTVELDKAPIGDVREMVNTTPAVVNGSFQGQRSEGSVYIVDGMKIRGDLTVPMNSIQEMRVITGALPAEYGDVLGGVIIIETKNPLNIYIPADYKIEKRVKRKVRKGSSNSNQIDQII